ncbi:MAG: response regulator transcription factor [Ahniella sp.]|nr:response regulator transcription factor [Ahniella sp.]
MTRARIALIDDQALVRRGLASLLVTLPGIELGFEAESGNQALQKLADQPVDLIVSDIRMADGNGIELIRALRARGDLTPVILLTTFDDPDLLLAAAQVGAQGFLLKDASPEDLEQAIHRVLRGEVLLQPMAIDPVRAQVNYREPKSPAHWSQGPAESQPAALGTVQLTEREIGIMRLLAGGYSNKEIARTLSLAEGTVKNYVSDILAKLETRDRTRAVLKAISLRLI